MTATASTRPEPESALVDVFPKGFRFGVASSAYQVEGAVREDGRGESIWDRFCRRPGAVVNGDTGDVACDHYHRWERDLDLMAAMRLETYRFSIAWPRVQPDGGGALNPRGVAFYRRLVEGLVERGIEPVATLYHWDLPQARQDAGGWASRDTAERFAEYAAAMGDALGDVVAAWITHNEPWVVSILGHALGTKAPGVRDWPTALTVSHHLLYSHGLAVDALRARVPAGTPIGLTLNPVPVVAASVSEDDRAAAVRVDGHHNRWFLDPVLRGRYPDDMVALYERRFGGLTGFLDGDLAVISRPIDFLGVNYYCPLRVRHAPGAPPLDAEAVGTPASEVTAMGWEVDPDGLHELLLRLRRDYGDLPIYITENGAAFEDAVIDGRIDDFERIAYLDGHLRAVGRALADGVDVRRYFAWSLLDNFEWEHGYGKRFGIVHVDFETQRRTPKRSGLWYRDCIAGLRG